MEFSAATKKRSDRHDVDVYSCRNCKRREVVGIGGEDDVSILREQDDSSVDDVRESRARKQTASLAADRRIEWCDDDLRKQPRQERLARPPRHT